MTKEQTAMLKGVAIVMMVFLHLFNHAELAARCHNFLFVGGQPLVHILARACRPVPFFLILSGYGLSYVYAHAGLRPAPQARRLLRLYVHYWVILLIFVAIGHFVRPDYYPGDVGKLLLNLSGYRSTYNYETWFLLPYALLSVTAWGIFRCIDKLGAVRFFLLSMAVSLCAAYVTSRYIAPAKAYDAPWALPCTYLNLQGEFTLGALLYRYVQRRPLPRLGAVPTFLLLAVLMVVECLAHTSALSGFYALAWIVLLLPHLPQWGAAATLLRHLGRRSMGIWMIHSYFCYYLFQDLTYSLRYPLLIFACLMAVSYLCAMCTMRLSEALIQRLGI